MDSDTLCAALTSPPIRGSRSLLRDILSHLMLLLSSSTVYHCQKFSTRNAAVFYLELLRMQILGGVVKSITWFSLPPTSSPRTELRTILRSCGLHYTFFPRRIVDPLTLSSTLSAISEEKNLTYLLDPIECNHNTPSEKLGQIATLTREMNLRYQKMYSRQQRTRHHRFQGTSEDPERTPADKRLLW